MHRTRLVIGMLLSGLSAVWSQGSAVAQLPPGGDPPFIATPGAVVDAMLDLAGIRPGETVYDLGSGDGRLVIAAARRGARAIGIEYDRDLVALAERNAAAAGPGITTTFRHGDVFDTDLRDADVVLLYLSPEYNLRVRPRLLDQLAPGSRVVSHAFHMGEWSPDSTVTLGSGASRATIFAWTVPANLDGFWRLRIEGDSELSLEIRQEFQVVSGTAWRDGLRLHVTGRVTGREVSLEMSPMAQGGPAALSLRGTISNGGIDGGVLLRQAARPRRWMARRYTDASTF